MCGAELTMIPVFNNPIPEVKKNWVVSLTPSVYRQLEEYDSISTEIGGLGLLGNQVIPNPDEEFEFKVKQLWPISSGEESDPGYCAIPDDKRAEVFRKLPEDKKFKLKCWFHIHGVQGWSSVDRSTQRQRVEEARPTGKRTWGLSIVKTPLGVISRYDQAGDNPEDNVTYDLVTVVGSKAQRKKWSKEIAAIEEANSTATAEQRAARGSSVYLAGAWDKKTNIWMKKPGTWNAGSTHGEYSYLDIGNMSDAEYENWAQSEWVKTKQEEDKTDTETAKWVKLKDTEWKETEELDDDDLLPNDKLDTLTRIVRMVAETKEVSGKGGTFPCLVFSDLRITPAYCGYCPNGSGCYSVTTSDVEDYHLYLKRLEIAEALLDAEAERDEDAELWMTKIE